MSPRWRKVIKDLIGNKTRTFLVVLTIMVGVFAVGFVANLIQIVTQDMEADFQRANGSGATIYTDPFDDDLLHNLENIPGVADIAGVTQAGGKTTAPNGNEVGVSVTAINGIQTMDVNKLVAIDPPDANLPGKHEVFVERSAMQGMGLKLGDTLNVELENGYIRKLRIAGIVHAASGFPYQFTQSIDTYANRETVEWMGGSRLYSQMAITVEENKTDDAHVRAVAARVAEKVEQSGRTVYYTQVFRPGRHFAYDITNSLGALMGFFGLLAVLLSAFLVINTVNALLGQHVRQIGVMKAVGARTGQMVGMYLVLVLCFGLISLAISIPAAGYFGSMIARGMGSYLNVEPGPDRIPVPTIVLQTVLALVIPLGAAILPILKGTRITIREAITSYGLGSGRFGASLIDRLVEHIRGLPRPLLISIRNTFRRKLRLALTLSGLTLAGAIFIAVFNMKASLDLAIEEILGYVLSDVNVNFSQWYRMQKVEAIADSIPGVVHAEGWGIAAGNVLTADRKTSTQVQLIGPPALSTLIDPTITQGRWLRPDDENAVVIGNSMTAARPELKVGDTITIQIDDKETEWRIVGVYRMGGNPESPILYANYEYLGRVMGTINQVFALRVVTAQHDGAFQDRVSDQLQAAYAAKGVKVGNITTGAFVIAQNMQTTDILVYFLLVMAVLIAVVGGLGLTSTMSINVIERTREIGVLRAIGASNRSVQSIIILEGMMIGTISWILGALLAIPIGIAVANVVGQLFLQSPMEFVFSMNGFVIWLVIVLIISSAASYLPARSASRLTIREVLAYDG